MPYIKDKNLINIYEEVDKANQTIGKLTNLLKEEEENNSILKKHRALLGILGLLLLIIFLWSFLSKDKADKINDKYLIENNLALVDADSLALFRDAAALQVADAFIDEEGEEQTTGLEGETIVYSVQIGAFNNFKAKLFSDDLAHMKEFEEGGLNKYAIGNFITYKEASELKNDLRNLGFKDCFVIAQSYGQPVNIQEALQLSEETEYLSSN